jgi:predicted RNA-binding Zn-ribbon protein involved in translation (DUF1610 family)
LHDAKTDEMRFKTEKRKTHPDCENPMSEKKSTQILTQTGSGRLTCPKCGNNQKNMIRETEDPDHIVNDYPRIVGKKYQCGKCGTWWRRVEDSA